MSTFPGLVHEFPGICIDRFDSEVNLKCTHFFLSHAHRDHMVGLDSEDFYQRIRDGDVHFFSSSATKIILSNSVSYSEVSQCITVLHQSQKTQIFLKSGEVFVTALPAGHCLGSFMFLIEDSRHRILYTGDFRLHPALDFPRFDFLRDKSGNLKRIDAVYLDTTFISHRSGFPSRKSATKELLKIIRDWLNQSTYNVIRLITSASIGYEYVFKSISEKLDTKLHVTPDQERNYRGIASVKKFITSDPGSTRIHACYKEGHRSGLPCGYSSENMNIREIKLCAMTFALSKNLPMTVISPSGMYRVCFATHASYHELRATLSYLLPKRAYASVVPIGWNYPRTQLLLDRLLKDIHRAANSESSSETQQSTAVLGTQDSSYFLNVNLSPSPTRFAGDLAVSSAVTIPKTDAANTAVEKCPRVRIIAASQVDEAEELVELAFEGDDPNNSAQLLEEERVEGQESDRDSQDSIQSNDTSSCSISRGSSAPNSQEFTRSPPGQRNLGDSKCSSPVFIFSPPCLKNKQTSMTTAEEEVKQLSFSTSTLAPLKSSLKFDNEAPDGSQTIMKARRKISAFTMHMQSQKDITNDETQLEGYVEDDGTEEQNCEEKSQITCAEEAGVESKSAANDSVSPPQAKKLKLSEITSDRLETIRHDELPIPKKKSSFEELIDSIFDF